MAGDEVAEPFCFGFRLSFGVDSDDRFGVGLAQVYPSFFEVDLDSVDGGDFFVLEGLGHLGEDAVNIHFGSELHFVFRHVVSGVGLSQVGAFDVFFGQLGKEECGADDVIVSLDADTYVNPGYLHSIAENFAQNPSISAVAVPYYHKLDPADERMGRAMLRSELYMRNYAINLLKINSPYGFTALGSAIAMRASALRKIGNVTPLQSGEDFYLVQKFCKMGGLSLFNTECVYPAGRYSDRVPFGTGPAIRRGAQGVWESYPIYHRSCFSPIREAYLLLPDLYRNRVSGKNNDFLAFLQKDGTKRDVWDDIRHNVTDFDHFVKAFHQKADGLRILQYVRTKYRQNTFNEEIALYENMRDWLPDPCPAWFVPGKSLDSYTLEQVDSLRDLLFDMEQQCRERYH